jgi:hypothetical protein
MPRKTRKVSKAEKAAKTIPELRKSFEKMDSFIHSKVCKLSDEEGVKAFKKEWKRLFGKEVSTEAATEYLHFARKAAGKEQKGGYAPLAYDMRPGVQPEVSVPPYVSGGFGFANNDSLVLGGPKDYLLNVPDAVKNNTVIGGGKGRGQRKTIRHNKRNGKGQKGGSISSTFAEFSSRPFGMSSPPTSGQELTMILKGGPGFASPLPEVNGFPALSNQGIFSGMIHQSVAKM